MAASFFALTLLLQGGPLPDALQPALEAGATLALEPDPAYAQRLVQLAELESWPWELMADARPQTSAQRALLATALLRADERALRLYATLAAGCSEDSPLASALWRRGTGILPEAGAVACLLAPARASEAWWPALAQLAARTTAPLAVRAAAISRLLDSGCDAAWPWARAVLLTGTARDAVPDPFADWRRGGRYELPKRLIVAALDAHARARGETPCGFEPNAAWAEQERAVARIAAVWGQSVERPEEPLSAPWTALIHAAADGDLASQRALAMLGAARPAVLRSALASGDASLAVAARRALEERPR